MGTDKAGLEILGRPMALWVSDALYAGGIDRVVALGGSADIGLETLQDREPGLGPLAVLMDAIRRYGDIMVCPCDVPGLEPATVRALTAKSESSERSVVLARSDRLEPLIGVYRSRSLAVLEAGWQRGVRGPKLALQEHHYDVVDVTADSVHNVNTPADVARVSALLQGR